MLAMMIKSLVVDFNDGDLVRTPRADSGVDDDDRDLS